MGARCRLNGVQGVLTNALTVDKGFDNVTGRDDSGIGAPVRNEGVSAGGPTADMYIGRTVIYDFGISLADNLAIEGGLGGLVGNHNLRCSQSLGLTT